MRAVVVGWAQSIPSPYIQRGHGIGDYLGPLFRALKPLFFTGAKSAGKVLGRAALRIGGKIHSDIADNPEMNYKDVISKNVQVNFQNWRSTMMEGGRKRKRLPPSRTKRPSAKRRKRAPFARRKPKGKPKRRQGSKRRTPGTPSGIKRYLLNTY